MSQIAGRAEFDAVFTASYPRARKLAYRITGSEQAAEDAASEAFARAYVDWVRVGSLAHREAWIMRVTTNLAIDVARRRPTTELGLDPPAVDDGAEDLVAIRETLLAALAALPRRQREAVVLRHLAGYPPHEVAVAMGVSDNSVKKHLQRGLAHLRRTLPALEGADLEFS